MWSIGKSDGRVNLWEGAIRSGKTFASILRWFIFIAMAPRTGELVMIGKSRDSLYRNVISPIMQNPEYAMLRPFIRYRAGADRAYIFGREVHVLGASDGSAEGKIRGMTVIGAYIDELTMIHIDVFKQMLGRMSPAGAQLFATTNPDSPAHWLKVEYLDKLGQLPDWRRFHFTLDDNPGLGLDYIASIKREYSGLWYKRFILGLWVAAEGAIFTMWDPERHVKRWDDMPNIKAYIGNAADYGTTNPTHALSLGVSRELQPGLDGRDHWRSRLWIMREWRYDSRVTGETLTDLELSERYRAWRAEPQMPSGNIGLGYKPRFDILDPSAASFRAQLHKDQLATAAADNRVGPGITLLANLLLQNALVITDQCPGLTNEIPGYAWDPKKSEEGHDVPVKVADHGIDALRYLVQTTEPFWRSQMDWPQELWGRNATKMAA